MGWRSTWSHDVLSGPSCMSWDLCANQKQLVSLLAEEWMTQHIR